jgi:hypothetical protein
MTKSRRMRIQTPVDLLALVPCLFGFHPEDSLVLVTDSTARQPVNVRVDLPVDDDEIDELVAHLADVVGRNGVRLVTVVCYTDDAALAGGVFERLEARLRGAGVRVGEAVRADGSRYWSLTGCTGACCPADGTPYDLSSHPFTAQAVLDGRVTLGSRRQLADSLVGADPDAVEAVQAAADAALTRLAAAARSPLGPPAPEALRTYLVSEGHWVEHRVRRFLDDGAPPDAHDVGRLLVGLAQVEVRDVAWATMDGDNARQHVELWRAVVRDSPRDLLAPPAALLGFAAWLSGDGALAWCAVDRCQEAEPDYSLALLLTDALSAAVPPSSWRPVARDMLSLFAG